MEKKHGESGWEPFIVAFLKSLGIRSARMFVSVAFQLMEQMACFGSTEIALFSPCE